MDLAEYRKRSLKTWETMAPGWLREREYMWNVSRPVGEWLVAKLGPQPGQTILELAAGVGDTGFVAARELGEDGKLRAFHNTCRHRGSILCTEERGRLPGRRIVCPYHTWSYGLDGELVATPRQMETPGFDRSAYPLFKVAIGSWGGFIFVNLAGDRAAPLAEALGDVPTRFHNYSFADLRIGKRIVMDVKANWKLLFENFSECFHCPPVHPELCEIATLFWDAGAWGLRKDDAGNAIQETRLRFKPGAATLTMDGTARIPPFKGLTAEERSLLYASQTLRPNLFLNVHPDYVNYYILTPIDVDRTTVESEWMFAPGSASSGARRCVSVWRAK